MIDVKTAEELVARYCINLSNESIQLENLEGRILSEPIYSVRKQPPFDRIAMDGIAIRFEKISNNKFIIEGVQKAGSPALELKNMDGAIEVMTGAVLPIGVDTVIPYERISIENEVAKIHDGVEVNKAQNIHFEGSDYKSGDVLLEKGLKLNSAAIAIIASQGSTKASVVKYPKLAIVSTGDELVEPGKDCEAWQIWRSNAYALKAELKSFGVSDDKISLFHLEDSEQAVYNSIKEILDTHDGLIISGGISMGKYDFVQNVMSDLKVKEIYYKIKQKPGKPMYFGRAQGGQVIFALPGNPVSALVCMRRYVIPSLNKSLENLEKSIEVILSEDVSFKKEFTFFKAVNLSSCEGKLMAKPLKSNGSGDFSSLAASDGFIELPADKELFKAGEVFKFFPWSGGVL